MKLINNIPIDSGFKTPEGYFESNITNIKDRIALEKTLGSKTPSGFTVPENYFTVNAINIKDRIALEKAIGAKVPSGFKTPENYFENNISHINNYIKLENIIGEEVKSGFTTPESYFENTISNIKDRVELESKLTSSKDTFDVPEGYFNSLNERLNVETLSRKQNKDITPTLLEKKTKVLQLRRYINPAIGIAASLLLLVSIFLNQDQPTVNTDSIELVAITDYFDTYSETIYDTELEELLTEEDLLSLENDVAIEEDVLIDYLEDRTDSYDYYLQ